MSAWDEAYGLLAGELIAAESRLYDRAGVGPRHRHPMRIMDRSYQTEDILTFTLQPVAGGAPPSFRPGQYVSLAVELKPGFFQQRQYSLSDAPNDRHWRISVKREVVRPDAPAGAVSNWLHGAARVGDTIMVSQPFGDFTPELDGRGPIALLAAGVGVTPLISVLNALAERKTIRKVVFAYAARSRAQVAHLGDVRVATQRLGRILTCFFLESGEQVELAGSLSLPGRMNAGSLLAIDPDILKAEFYLCGPLGFMRDQHESLVARGVPLHCIHREVFGPDVLDNLP